MKRTLALSISFIVLLSLLGVAVHSWSQSKTQPTDTSKTGSTEKEPKSPGIAVPQQCSTLPSNIKYFWVSPLDFRPANDLTTALPSYSPGSFQITYSHLWIKIDINTIAFAQTYGVPSPLLAPLNIPEGATLREIRFEFLNDTPDTVGTVTIFKQKYDTNGKSLSVENLATFSSNKSASGSIVRRCDFNLKATSDAYWGIEFRVGAENKGPKNNTELGISGIRLGYTAQ